MMNRCIIFDLDDTLVDSETLCNRAFYDLLPDLKYNFEHLKAENRGKKLSIILENIEKKVGRDLSPDFEKKYRERVAELFNLELKSNNGVVQALESIPYPMCVASSGPLPKIRHALEITKLDHFFKNNLFSSYEVGSWKPEPYLFLHAAKSMNTNPENCIVVEDSQPGILAAKAANMDVLQYYHKNRGDKSSHIKKFSEMSVLPKLIDDVFRGKMDIA